MALASAQLWCEGFMVDGITMVEVYVKMLTW